MSNELINDIEDSLRREQLHANWKEYGPWIIGGVLIAILITAVSTGWQSYTHRRDAAHTEALVKALATDDVPTALAALEGDLGAGPQAVAYLSAAGIHLRDNQFAEALALFNKAAADKSLPGLYRDLATLQAVRIGWDLETPTQAAGNEGATTADAYLASLKPITQNKKSPWQHHALLQSALIAANDKQDYKAARAFLAPILDSTTVPASLQERARALDHLYATELALQAEPAPSSEAPTPKVEDTAG